MEGPIPSDLVKHWLKKNAAAMVEVIELTRKQKEDDEIAKAEAQAIAGRITKLKRGINRRLGKLVAWSDGEASQKRKSIEAGNVRNALHGGHKRQRIDKESLPPPEEPEPAAKLEEEAESAADEGGAATSSAEPEASSELQGSLWENGTELNGGDRAEDDLETQNFLGD